MNSTQPTHQPDELRNSQSTSHSRIFRSSLQEEAETLKALILAQKPQIFDTYREQLIELIETRFPNRKLTPAQVEEELSRALGDTPIQTHGNWIYLPWRNTLVHLLDETNFIELRTSRNQYKITAAEQKTLQSKKIGIVGLSVGHSIALTLATERVAGELRLADFDTLSLSNLNRIRTGIHQLGQSKVSIAATEIAEQDPYLQVRCFPGGLSSATLESFFLGGGKLDLVVDECDDLGMKAELRRFARENRIPVVMATSDRGVLDIERFDLEPSRPIFHGWVSEDEAFRFSAMTPEEKVPYVLQILGGASELSPRTAASLLEIGSTLKTWPQLASEVTLGGAMAADVCRRILLGELTASGRFRVDLEELVCDPARPAGNVTPTPKKTKRFSQESSLSANGLIKAIVARAITAPSGGNSQPWSFRHLVSENTLELSLDPSRASTFLDFESKASWMSLGAAAENTVLAASELGLDTEMDVFPEADRPHLAARFRLKASKQEKASSPWSKLSAYLEERHSNRRLGDGIPLASETTRALRAAAESISGARMHLITDPEMIAEMGAILGEGERFRLLHSRLHQDMMEELRWSRQECEESRDGIDLDTLELTLGERAGVSLCRSEKVMKFLAQVQGGHSFETSTKKLVRSSSAIGLLTMPSREISQYFLGGRALSRLWLTATSLGIAFQPMSSLPYLFARLEHGGTEDFSSSERTFLTELRRRYLRIFPLDRHGAELLIFRLFRAKPPSVRALRRAPEEVLELVTAEKTRN